MADVAKILRVFLTSKSQTPNLYEVMQAMGEERVKNRLKKII
ncbi:MAG: hypothetical protein NTZ42_00360 [Candidatus Gribaldobacteria bacterium]|nr:hypothetical protein [Candidatus Gribaldobacteria bacterium]